MTEELSLQEQLDNLGDRLDKLQEDIVEEIEKLSFFQRLYILEHKINRLLEKKTL